jgi:uncharacterized membrane protein YdjX (TVP38/TMEM64 family)
LKDTANRQHDLVNRPGPEAPAPTRRWRRSAAVAAAVVLGVAFFAFDPRGLLREALAAIERLGPWGPVLFVLVYVVATVFLVPGSLLTLGAGAVFGVVRGCLYVSIASTLGATCAFLVGRHLARDWVERRIAGHPAFNAMDQAVAADGWKIVGLARLSPVLPFVLLNYALGLTRISLKGYVLASWIGMLPGTVMYVYLGSLARAGTGNGEQTPAQWAFYAVGLVATVAVTLLLTRLARRALSRAGRFPPAAGAAAPGQSTSLCRVHSSR